MILFDINIVHLFCGLFYFPSRSLRHRNMSRIPFLKTNSALFLWLGYFPGNFLKNCYKSSSSRLLIMFNHLVYFYLVLLLIFKPFTALILSIRLNIDFVYLLLQIGFVVVSLSDTIAKFGNMDSEQISYSSSLRSRLNSLQRSGSVNNILNKLITNILNKLITNNPVITHILW